MNKLAALVITFFDLADAEGRLLRHGMVILVLNLLILAMCGLLLLGGMVMCLCAMYLMLASIMSVATATLLSGLIAILLGGGFLLYQLYQSRHIDDETEEAKARFLMAAENLEIGELLKTHGRQLTQIAVIAAFMAGAFPEFRRTIARKLVDLVKSS